jgi:hypothetical protein
MGMQEVFGELEAAKTSLGELPMNAVGVDVVIIAGMLAVMAKNTPGVMGNLQLLKDHTPDFMRNADNVCTRADETGQHVLNAVAGIGDTIETANPKLSTAHTHATAIIGEGQTMSLGYQTMETNVDDAIKYYRGFLTALLNISEMHGNVEQARKNTEAHATAATEILEEYIAEHS